MVNVASVGKMFTTIAVLQSLARHHLGIELATAGTTSAPVVPRTTAAPAATTDVRTFMISSPAWRPPAAAYGMMRPSGQQSKIQSGHGSGK